MMGRCSYGAKGEEILLGPDLGSSRSLWNGVHQEEANSERLGHSAEPEPLSSSVQGMRSGGEWRA